MLLHILFVCTRRPKSLGITGVVVLVVVLSVVVVIVVAASICLGNFGARNVKMFGPKQSFAVSQNRSHLLIVYSQLSEC